MQRRVKHAKWFSVRALWVVLVYLVSWPTVLIVIRKNVSYTWWRETLRVVLQNKGVIVISRLFFL
ncbi:hypothetical protein D3C80_2004590 [compost metagenome]